MLESKGGCFTCRLRLALHESGYLPSYASVNACAQIVKLCSLTFICSCTNTPTKSTYVLAVDVCPVKRLNGQNVRHCGTSVSECMCGMWSSCMHMIIVRM